ncbi:hypothetical protein NE237_002181 [Protea cynaroides]|uniref:VWFA domain-containing protein n=1 Tax=Protea cynaroides TaxID=273540 RepID=A0A9Q0KUR0_9MAGN|nr:hypothetical protein NE237_002181 [Protea cynaroides]
MEEWKNTFFSQTRDENVIKGSYTSNGKKIDVRPLHKLINEILMPSGTITNQAMLDSHLKSIQNSFCFQELSKIIHKICYQLSCKCSRGGDENSTTVALSKTLLPYSWEAKIVLALAAFTIIYGESLVMADQTNWLAKSIKLLKLLPDKWKLSKIQTLIHAMVKMTNKILDVNDWQPDQNISTYVQTVVESIVVCTSYIIGLDDEYTEDEFSKLMETVDGMNAHLGQLLDEMNEMTDGNCKLTIDENAIRSTHTPDGKKVKVRPLHKLINEMLTASVTSTVEGASQDQGALDSQLKFLKNSSEECLEELTETLDKICCELSCQCSKGEDANSKTVALFKMLSQYSWEVKMVLALAAFSIIYGESSLMANRTNPLADSIKLLKQVPEKSKLSKIRSLIDAMVKVTNTIVKVVEVDESPPENMSTHIETTVSWTVGSIIICMSQIIGLDDEYTEDELSKLTKKVEGMNTYLSQELDTWCQTEKYKGKSEEDKKKLGEVKRKVEEVKRMPKKEATRKPKEEIIEEKVKRMAKEDKKKVEEATRKADEKKRVIQMLQNIQADNDNGAILDSITLPENKEQVSSTLRESGLESSNLIIGIDFSASNRKKGQRSFNYQSLHDLSGSPNPYQQAIDIIGNTLAPFTKDNKIHSYGFGDASTKGDDVFSFHSDLTPCQGFEEVLTCYRKIAQKVYFDGPTCFAPIIEAAIDIVENSGGQHHVLVIIADDSIRQSKEIDSIVTASEYALSIVYVGVGDGPWDEMKGLADKIHGRKFDNFQFVNFYDIMKRYENPSEKEAAFSLVSTMKIPMQYKASKEHGFLGRTTGRPTKVVPRTPSFLLQ